MLWQSNTIVVFLRKLQFQLQLYPLGQNPQCAKPESGSGHRQRANALYRQVMRARRGLEPFGHIPLAHYHDGVFHPH